MEKFFKAEVFIRLRHHVVCRSVATVETIRSLSHWKYNPNIWSTMTHKVKVTNGYQEIN